MSSYFWAMWYRFIVPCIPKFIREMYCKHVDVEVGIGYDDLDMTRVNTKLTCVYCKKTRMVSNMHLFYSTPQDLLTLHKGFQEVLPNFLFDEQ